MTRKSSDQRRRGRSSLRGSGLDAPFLRLEESPAESQQAWEAFRGRLWILPRRGTETGGGGLWPVYHAGRAEGVCQSISPGTFTARAASFIWEAARCGGCGRRTRPISSGFTRSSLRHVAEGRLLRGTQRGSFLVERRRYVFGDRIEVDVSLRGPDQQPLAMNRITVHGEMAGCHVEDDRIGAAGDSAGRLSWGFCRKPTRELHAGAGAARNAL